MPQLLDGHPHNEDGVGGMHLYVPWWLDGKRLDFLRGYHLELWGGRSMPGYGFMGGIHNYNGLKSPDQQTQPAAGGGYGTQLKNDYRRFYGSTIGFSLRGEMIGRRENRCEIDPSVVDKYGIPVLRFHVTWSDQELQQARHGQETIREIIHTMGGTPLGSMPGPERDYGLSRPGAIIHEVGGTRMGHDPRSSVLNANCQAHEAKNVFVADGGPFVSQAHKNPTLSILALSWRTADYIVDQRNKGNL
jgi:choline dehydrogenase-like flavoprotein